jgi:hypothetical protein
VEQRVIVRRGLQKFFDLMIEYLHTDKEVTSHIYKNKLKNLLKKIILEPPLKALKEG